MVRVLSLMVGYVLTYSGKNPAFGPAQIRDLTETFVTKALEVWSADTSHNAVTDEFRTASRRMA